MKRRISELGSQATQDFGAVYSGEFDELQRVLLASLVDHPTFGPLLAAQSETQRKQETATGKLVSSCGRAWRIGALPGEPRRPGCSRCGTQGPVFRVVRHHSPWSCLSHSKARRSLLVGARAVGSGDHFSSRILRRRDGDHR